jgi:hypothetical protein
VVIGPTRLAESFYRAPAASRSGGGARPAAKAARPCFQYRCISTRVWLFPASSVGSIKMSLDDSGAKQQPPTAPSTKNEMAGLIASKDWSTTALGDANNWSPSLKLIVGIMTASGFPMAVRWGPELILIYNDGYRTILADKHPWALGLPFRVVWPEVVSELIPLQEAILAGESPGVYSEDRPFTIRRRGKSWETAHFTVSYSPVADASSPTGIGGVLVTAVETTERLKVEKALESKTRIIRSQSAVTEWASPLPSRPCGWPNGHLGNRLDRQDQTLDTGRHGAVRDRPSGWPRACGRRPRRILVGATPR